MNINIKEFIKSEKEFSLIISLLILLAYFSALISTSFYSGVVDIYNLLLKYLPIIIPIMILIDIKNIKITFHHLCLLAFILIAICSTMPYINIDIDFSETIVSGIIFPALSVIYLSLPKKKYSEYRIIKMKIIRIVLIVLSLIVCVLSVVSDDSSGITLHKNILGFITTAMIMAVTYFIDEKKIYTSVPIVFIILFGLFITFFSKSRTSFVVSSLFLFIYAAVYIYRNINYKKNYYIILTIIIFVAIVLVFAFREKLFSFITNNIDEEELNDNFSLILSGRWILWTSRFPSLIKNDLLFGRGVHTLSRIDMKNLSFLYYSVENVNFLHNIILDTIYSGGMIGFMYLVIGGISYFISTVLKLNFKNRDVIYGNVVIIAILIYCTIDSYFIWASTPINFLLFLEIGNLSNLLNKEEKI